jgi:Fe-S cluster assembly scaffold protein SufB
MNKSEVVFDLYDRTDTPRAELQDPNVAHLVINYNQVLGMHSVPGLHIDVNELKDGIEAHIRLDPDTIVENQVHLCFGMVPDTGVQQINLQADIGARSRIDLLAHCVFPFAIDVQHIMDAVLRVGEGASYSYFEKHVHSPQGGVRVYPTAKVEVGPRASFKTEFELIKGRVGLIDVTYEATCEKEAVVDMLARISGIEDDRIRINEIAHLVGDYARGALTSKIAVRDRARAEINNTLIASGAYARGHVDCKEIIQDEGIATAVPTVEVKHPRARVTHEAAIGSVDNKQLETLLARGVSEDEAVELIINGLLARR